MAAHNISDERLRIIRELKKQGDRVLFPMALYDKITAINSDMNKNARIDGMIKRGEIIYSIRKKDKEHFYVIRRK